MRRVIVWIDDWVTTLIRWALIYLACCAALVAACATVKVVWDGAAAPVVRDLALHYPKDWPGAPGWINYEEGK